LNSRVEIEQTHKKIYCIILDGAADHKISCLQEKTPLEVAFMPNLDFFVQNGMMSRIEILPSTHIPETDSGLMALLGYNPIKYYCGRGALEAIGRGICQGYQYYVGFRVNFAAYDDGRNVLNRRTSRNLSENELKSLTDEIISGIILDKYPGVNVDLLSYGKHRGILTFYSNNIPLSGNVSNTDPGFLKSGYFSFPVENYDNKVLKCEPLDDTIAANVTAEIVNDFSEQAHCIMEQSIINSNRIHQGLMKCNYLLLRDGGSQHISMRKFAEKYNRRLAIYGELPCEKALADLIGADFYYSKELELQLDKVHLVQLANKLTESNAEIVFCHIKGPDEPGHDNDPIGKVKAIELIDRYFFGELRMKFQKGDIIMVSCDHATPCEIGIHSNDKVPLLVCGNDIEIDETIHFDEENAERGRGLLSRAIDVMEFLVERSK